MIFTLFSFSNIINKYQILTQQIFRVNNYFINKLIILLQITYNNDCTKEETYKFSTITVTASEGNFLENNSTRVKYLKTNSNKQLHYHKVNTIKKKQRKSFNGNGNYNKVSPISPQHISDITCNFPVKKELTENDGNLIKFFLLLKKL